MLTDFGVWTIDHMTPLPHGIRERLILPGFKFRLAYQALSQFPGEMVRGFNFLSGAHQGNLLVETGREGSTCIDLAVILTAELCLTRNLKKGLDIHHQGIDSTDKILT
jgi:hypothetical protein